MSEFWTGFFTGIAAWYVFGWLLQKLIIWLVLRVAREQIAELKAAEEEIMLRVEKHSDMYYCYRKDNDEFVGQAPTVEELAVLFKKKYPNNNGRILKDNVQGA